MHRHPAAPVLCALSATALASLAACSSSTAPQAAPTVTATVPAAPVATSTPASTATAPDTPAAPASPSTAASAPATTAPPEPTAQPSSSSPEPAPPAPTVTRTVAPSGPDRCHTSELTGTVTQRDAAAGQRYAVLVLRDTGGQTCTIHGYGGLALVGRDGIQPPTLQERSPQPAPRTVVLHPGQSVASQLHWSATAATGDSQTDQCQPTPVSLRVIPPDETDALTVAWSLGPVCQQGRILQQAYAAR